MTTRKVLTILAAVALAACGEDAKKIATGSVSGRALYQGRADHSGISVTVAGFSTTTGSTGAYSFAEIPTGTHVVVAVAPDSVERTLTTTVASGATAADLTFTPAIGLQGVATAIGGSSAGITVTLDGGATTTTAADGSYAFANVPDGIHSLSFAAPGYSDSISTIFFARATGALVPDATRQNAVYRMGPIELQNGRRLVGSTTVENTIRFSPDGTFFAYLEPTAGTNVGSLFAAPTDGGARVLVAANARQGNWKVGPDNKSVAYLADDGGLYAAVMTSAAPLAFGAPLKLGDNVSSNWDFSPQLTAAGSNATVYFLADNAIAGTTHRTLFEKSVTGTFSQTLAQDAYSSFTVLQKSKRIIFGDCQGTNCNSGTGFVRAWPATAAAVGSGIQTLEATYPATSNIRGYSTDQTVVVYQGQSVGATGVRALKLDGTSAPGVIDATTVSCVTNFAVDAANARVAILSCDAFPYSVRTNTIVSGGAPAVVNLGGTSVYWQVPRFSADGTRLLYITGTSPYNLVYGPPDGSAAPTTLDTGLLDNFSFPYDLAPAGAMAVYPKRDTSNSAYDLYQVATTSPAPTKIAAAVGSGVGRFTSAGSFILYEANRTGSFDLYLQSTTAGSSPTLVGQRYNTGGTLGRLGKISEDGAALLVQTDLDSATGGYDLKTVDLATGTVRTLVRATRAADWVTVGGLKKAASVRKSSAPPFGFQDGIYLTDIP